ncbi:hypothetical protein [uncultured Methanobrevibacter sp.]|uniref:hypothetical protein n=1 Tax=uncultured Methanobrevibacter sp. TaxID=253161 RepID=UPI0026DF09D7|nr:hypothetical protein [uncultured Methanobrevibacter sp.]
MSRKSNFLAYFLIIIFLIIIIGAVAGFVGSLFEPPKADYNDEVFEPVGDNHLNVTLKQCKKINEESIPDGSVETANYGKISYYDAKNITYVTIAGDKDYFIIWKVTADKYDFINKSSDVGEYLSDYLQDDNGKIFLEYDIENKCVYGVILGTTNITYSESYFLYNILGLNGNIFELMYAHHSTTGTSTSSHGSDHYHTVVGDRNSLAHNDPDSYYDHYDYGDDYEIDDYLESEGY